MMNKNKIFFIGAIGLIIITAAVYFVKNDITHAGNETSRLAVIQSVVDNGTFDITKSIFKTPDKALLDGKYYGDKPLRLIDLIEMVNDYDEAGMALNVTSPYRDAEGELD